MPAPAGRASGRVPSSRFRRDHGLRVAGLGLAWNDQQLKCFQRGQTGRLAQLSCLHWPKCRPIEKRCCIDAVIRLACLLPQPDAQIPQRRTQATCAAIAPATNPRAHRLEDLAGLVFDVLGRQALPRRDAKSLDPQAAVWFANPPAAIAGNITDIVNMGNYRRLDGANGGGRKWLGCCRNFCCLWPRVPERSARCASVSSRKRVLQA